MKILIPDWKSFGRDDIREALVNLGNEVIFYQKEPRNYRQDPRFRSELRNYIKEEHIDLIFSSNYYPILSNVCNDIRIPYVSWCYDSPLVLTYSDTIFHSCNFIFIFDSQMVTDLKALGVKQVYYLPMAVNSKRLSTLTVSPEHRKLLDADVAFVGSLYNEKHNLYDRFSDLPAYTKGYLEGIMAAQQQIYGQLFLEDCLTPEILEELQKHIPLEPSKDGHETLRYLYANYFLCRKITQTERFQCMKLLDAHKNLHVKLYTPNPTPQFTTIQNMGTVHYEKEMPLVFQCSRINLNISLRSIQSGIPLRAMDIMGAGGFLLTNYQRDFDRHFTAGKDYVYYENPDDMIKKIDYYLANPAKRNEIARSGQQKVFSEHTYEQRFQEILDIIQKG